MATLAEMAPIHLAAAWWLLAAIAALVFAAVLAKAAQLHRASASNRSFGAAFRSTNDLDAAARIASDHRGCARVADVGFGVLHHERGPDRQWLLERNLERQVRRERCELERGLGLLWSLGNAAMFAGLVGTLCGTPVFPLERLLPVTGMGLAIAMPAWLASKYLESRARSIARDLDDFVDDFLDRARCTAPVAASVNARHIFRPRLIIGSRKSS